MRVFCSMPNQLKLKTIFDPASGKQVRWALKNINIIGYLKSSEGLWALGDKNCFLLTCSEKSYDIHFGEFII